MAPKEDKRRRQGKKTREGEKAPPQKTPKKRTPIPEDWVPNEKHHELARELGLNIKTESEKFRDYALREGKKYKDVDAGFRLWLRNSAEFKTNRSRNQPPPQRSRGVNPW